MTRSLRLRPRRLRSSSTTVKVRHWKMAISLGVATVLLFLLFLLVPRDGVSTFRLGDPASSIDLPNVERADRGDQWAVSSCSCC